MRRTTLTLALGGLLLLALTSTALASHARPKSASPMNYRLVPAFDFCTNFNGIHEGTFRISSCVPPTQSSDYLTWNAPDRPAPFNTAVDGTGVVTLKMTCLVGNPPTENGDPAPCTATAGDQLDVLHTQSIADVRCVGVVGQGNCSAGAGSLYNGKLTSVASITITDHNNALSPNPPGPDCSDTSTCAGTTPRFPMTIASQCINGSCNTATSWDTVLAATIKEGKRAGFEILTFTVNDAGLDGNLVPSGTASCPPACMDNDPAGTFLRSGIFGP
jgi:hypothetical protein